MRQINVISHPTEMEYYTSYLHEAAHLIMILNTVEVTVNNCEKSSILY